MFSGAPFAEFAFCEQEDSPLDTDAFQAFLDDVTQPRCWLLELDAFSLASVSTRSSAFGEAAFGEMGFSDDDGGVSGGVEALRYSTHGYISRVFSNVAGVEVAGGDADYPYWWDGRLTDQIRLERNATRRDGVGGLTRVFAELELLNGDGGLDQMLVNYSLDGRHARLWVGRPTDRFADFGVVFTGVVEMATVGLNAARITLSDGLAKLLRAINETTYAGTGGLEGGADLAGKKKPKCYGSVSNVMPPLVDSATLVYQVHDDAISDVSAVYDRGIALVKVVGVPAAGQYSVDTAAGTFRLGTTPAGTVTCNVQGDASGAGYVNTTSDIVLRMLAAADLTTSEIDSTAFAALKSDVPAEVGIWIGTETRLIASAVDELLAGVGAFGGFSRHGAFTVDVITSPEGVTPAATYTEREVIDMEREPLPDMVGPIAWRALIGYQQNYTVQNDLAETVPAARRTFTAEPQRVVKHEDSNIKTRYLLAKEYGPVKGLYASEADAQAEVDRLFALWGVPRGSYRLRLPLTALTRDIGNAIHLTHPRHGFAAGKTVRVLGHSVQGNAVELKVLV